MTDIVDRLLKRVLFETAVDPYKLMREAAAEIERIRARYEQLARHIAPDVDAEYIWSHLPEQIIDAGLQRQAYAISEARATGRREGLSEAAKIAEGNAKTFNLQQALVDWDDMLVGGQSARLEIAAAIRAAMEKEE